MSLKLKIIFNLLFFTTIFNSNAQDNIQPKLYLKILPTTFIEPTGGVQIGAEYFIVPNLSVQQDVAYLNSQSSLIYLIEEKEISGYRLSSELKFFFHSFKYENPYFSTNIVIKKTIEPTIVSIDYLDGAYSQFFDVDKSKSLFAFHLKFGNQITFENTPFCIDFYAGIGYRHLEIDRTNIPDNTELHEFAYNTRDDGIYNSPSFTTGIKLGIKLW